MMYLINILNNSSTILDYYILHILPIPLFNIIISNLIPNYFFKADSHLGPSSLYPFYKVHDPPLQTNKRNYPHPQYSPSRMFRDVRRASQCRRRRKHMTWGRATAPVPKYTRSREYRRQGSIAITSCTLRRSEASIFLASRPKSRNVVKFSRRITDHEMLLIPCHFLMMLLCSSFFFSTKKLQNLQVLQMTCVGYLFVLSQKFDTILTNSFIRFCGGVKERLPSFIVVLPAIFWFFAYRRSRVCDFGKNVTILFILFSGVYSI